MMGEGGEKVQLFIGWSGERSQYVAEGFKKWIPTVIQAVKPWMSTSMERGLNWIKEVSGKLAESRIGVFILTPENLKAPWVLFEAGALSKTLSEEREHVCTLLVGLDPGDVGMPLEQFQSTPATSDDVWKLVKTINKALKNQEQSLEESLLRSTFEAFWPKLEEVFTVALKMPGSAKPPRRPDRDILDEILERTRQNANAIESLDTRLTLSEGRRLRKWLNVQLDDQPFYLTPATGPAQSSFMTLGAPAPEEEQEKPEK
jgi:hypothetical protein